MVDEGFFAVFLFFVIIFKTCCLFVNVEYLWSARNFCVIGGILNGQMGGLYNKYCSIDICYISGRPYISVVWWNQIQASLTTIAGVTYVWRWFSTFAETVTLPYVSYKCQRESPYFKLYFPLPSYQIHTSACMWVWIKQQKKKNTSAYRNRVIIYESSTITTKTCRG